MTDCHVAALLTMTVKSVSAPKKNGQALDTLSLRGGPAGRRGNPHPPSLAPPLVELSAQLTERAVQRRGYARLLLVKFNIAICIVHIRKCDRTIAPIINSSVGKIKVTIVVSTLNACTHGCLTGAALHNFIAIRWGHL